MRSIPINQAVCYCAYADYIAFFSAARDIRVLYELLQAYYLRVNSSLNLKINVNKCTVLMFSVFAPISLRRTYLEAAVPQVTSLKYFCVIYDSTLDWRPHLKHIAIKGEWTVGLLQRISNRCFAIRRDTLLFIYRSMCAILEFGCVLFSGSTHTAHYVERGSPRLCLDLPKCVVNNI